MTWWWDLLIVIEYMATHHLSNCIWHSTLRQLMKRYRKSSADWRLWKLVTLRDTQMLWDYSEVMLGIYRMIRKWAEVFQSWMSWHGYIDGDVFGDVKDDEWEFRWYFNVWGVIPGRLTHCKRRTGVSIRECPLLLSVLIPMRIKS